MPRAEKGKNENFSLNDIRDTLKAIRKDLEEAKNISELLKKVIEREQEENQRLQKLHCTHTNTA